MYMHVLVQENIRAEEAKAHAEQEKRTNAAAHQRSIVYADGLDDRLFGMVQERKTTIMQKKEYADNM